MTYDSNTNIPDLLNPEDPWYSEPRSIEEQREVVRAWNKHRREVEKASGSAAGQQMALQDTVSSMTTLEKTGYFMQGINLAGRAYQRGKLEWDAFRFEKDEDFDGEAALQKYKNEIHPSLWNRAASSESQAEFDAVLKLSKEQEYARAVMAEAGAHGDLLPAVLATVVDVDIALAFLAGGSYLGPKMASGVARATLYRSPRIASMGYGAGAGLEVAAIGELGNRALGMGYEAQDLPTVLGTSLVFGTGVGALTKMERHATRVTKEKLATQRLKKAGFTRIEPEASAEAVAQAETLAAVRSAKVDTPVDTPVASPAAVTKVGEDFTPGLAKSGSAGAAKLGATHSRKYSPVTEKVSLKSENDLQAYGFDWDGTNLNADTSKWGKVVDTLEDTLNVLPWLRLDMDVMMHSRAPTAVLLALQTMEHASGRFRTGKMTVALEKKALEDQMLRNVALLPNAQRGWLKSKGYRNTAATRTEFMDAVAEEMDNRFYGGTRGQDEWVNQIADAMDADFKLAADLLKARGVQGAENLNWRPGWRPHRWSGAKLQALIDAGLSIEQIEQGLVNGYKAVHPDWSEKALRTTAKAVIARMRVLGDGVDTNIYRILQTDGRKALEELYLRNGMSKTEFDEFVELLDLGAAERGKAKILKSRNEIDLRTEIPGSNFQLRHLMENDLMRVNSQYARQASGYAALANIGIRSKADWDTLWDAIQDEIAVNGGRLTGVQAGRWTDSDSKFKEYLWASLTGGAPNKEVKGMARRLIQISNLSLLNQMGFTQAAELATVVGANGFSAAVDYLRAKGLDLRDKSIRKALWPELQELTSPIEGMHNLQRSDLQLDEYPQSLRDAQKLAQKHPDVAAFMDEHFRNGGTVDQLLGKAGRLQGYLSGFYAARHFGHMLHDQTFIHMLGRHIAGTNKISAKRLNDLGFTPEIMDKLRKDWKHVEYDGKVITKLGMDKWSQDSINALRLIMTRSRYQNVQEGLFGEGMFWMSTTMGALMGNLRSFTLLAARKQTLRHARIADSRSIATAGLGIPFAGLVSWVRDTVNGREDAYDPMRIMNRALNYSGMGAPIPMIADPILGLIGMDDWQFGLGAREFNGPFQIVPGIPSFETMNKLGRIPASAWNLAFGDAKPSDVTQMQAIPLIGNAIGFNTMFNSIKQDIALERAERKKRERAEARAAKAAEKAANKKQAEDKKTGKAEKAETINPLNTLEEL